MTHYLEQKTNYDIPIVFPMNLIHDNKFSNLSEQNRWQKFTNLFTNLKYFIENNEDNEEQIIKEVNSY